MVMSADYFIAIIPKDKSVDNSDTFFTKTYHVIYQSPSYPQMPYFT